MHEAYMHNESKRLINKSIASNALKTDRPESIEGLCLPACFPFLYGRSKIWTSTPKALARRVFCRHSIRCPDRALPVKQYTDTFLYRAGKLQACRVDR